MKSRLLTGIALAMCVAFAGPAFAVEPYLEIVQGLREQGYYDYALLYLDQIAGKENTPAEIKQVISFEKAITFQESAKTMRPEKQMEQLNQAQDFLEQFVKDNPNHPKAGDANSQRATILLNKGQSEVQQAKSPTNQGGKRDFQNRAREYIGKAREVFQTAFDQHEANFKKFPAFIDQQKDPDQYAARAKVEQNLITAALNLGTCTYEEAQTYDPSSPEFKQLLNKAADEFEKMHQKYRSQVGGLYARAWQGKCYEEQKDIQKAMGIYNELLEHPGEDRALSKLKSQTLYFKLICLNSKDRNDHQLVVDLAEEWVKKHKGEDLSTQLGLSIQWEQARAYETLSEARDIIAPDKERNLKQARAVAMEIQKFSSEYKDVATAMVSRITTKLGGKEKEPDDFASGNGLAQQHFATAQDIKKEIDALVKRKGPADEISKLTVDWNNELKDAARYYELALKYVKPNDDKKAVSQARLFASYVYYYQRKNYEAAVLASYVARTADKDDGTLGLDSAYIAMAAFVQAYNDFKAPVDQKQEDMQLIVKSCNLIAERWPSSDKANEAYLILGRMLSAQKKPAEAAIWFGKVPEADPMYPEAQLAAGQAYYTAYLGSNRMIGPEKPTPEVLSEWLKSAESHLRNGIANMSKKYPATGAAPPELIGAKLSLSQIIVSQGKDAEALKLLLDDPQSVIKAVTVNDEKDRAETGVTSRNFAMATYKQVFRAYIGTDNLDKARETMAKLEEIAAGGGVDGGGEVTELYMDLGKKLKDELERLRQNDEKDRYSKLMTSFETFLNDMASRKEGQTFGTLSWVGETYFALGESVEGDAAKASTYFDKAGTAFAEILSRAKDNAEFASAMQLYNIKVRQVYVLRLKKDFAPAEALINDIVKENQNNLKAQTAAAELYQDWGSSGQADSVKKLITAIQGSGRNGPIWGWIQIGTKLQKSGEFPANPVYVEQFLNARYNATVCRRKYALEQVPKEKQKYLDGCKKELAGTASVTKEMPDEWYQKFNALYQDVLKDLGQPVANLTRVQEDPAATKKAEEPEKPIEKDVPKEATPTATAAVAENPKEGGMGMAAWGLFFGCILFGLGAIGWVFMKSQGKQKHKAISAATSAGAFTGISVPDAALPSMFDATAITKPKQRPATAGTTGTKPAAKPASKPAPTGSAAPKPKPKPPTPPTK